jgi:KDO2-lipid IV(A) lauroyltransferase
LENLRLALPELSPKKRMEICRQSYRHFVDIFMEMIKSFTISEKQINDHYRYTNTSFLHELHKDGKSVALVGAHYGNWEWVLNINAHVPYEAIAAFTPVTNRFFNNRILKSRGKFGVKLVPTSKTIPAIAKQKKDNIQSIYGLLSDQSPSLRKTFYWSEFFGVKVPIHTGAEMLAKKYDLNIVMMVTRKVKRGYYETTFSLITDDANAYPNYELTDMFLRKTEAIVRSDPAYYLWTHRRFKHKDKAPEGQE